MTQIVENLNGWYALHDFRTLNWEKWQLLDQLDKTAALSEANDFFSKYASESEKHNGLFGAYEIQGHKADLLFVHLKPSFDELTEIEREFDKTRLAQCMAKSYSYVSIVELSNYVHDAGSNPYENDHVKARLYPKMPNFSHVCFYPMNKKRDGEDNWYSLPFEKRQTLMKSHGLTGRAFAGKLTQMITGSCGLDLWEWGVTLFANEPSMFKEVVYKMRFDEVSAKYGEFGDFYVGKRLSQEKFNQMF